MKKLLSMLLLFTILLSSSNSVVFAAAKPVLTTRETAIAKAYVKVYETGNSSGIKNYTYPGANVKVDAVPDTTKIKVFFPEYTNKYDSKSKMNCIIINCVTAVSDGTKLTIFKGTLGINLKIKGKTAYAYSKNTTIAKLNEIQVSDMEKAQVDKIQAYLTDNYGAAVASKMLFGNPKALTATFDAPAALGSTYTYNKTYSRMGDTLSGEFSITINKVIDLTDADLKELGYGKSDHEQKNADYFKYKLVNVTWEVKDAKIVELAVNGSNKERNKNVYKRYIRPLFAGTSDAHDSTFYLGICGFDGFAGSFQSNMNDKFKWSSLEVNSTVSFTMTGNVILPTQKEAEDYMRFEKVGTESYIDHIYFKIQ